MKLSHIIDISMPMLFSQELSVLRRATAEGECRDRSQWGPSQLQSP